MNVVGEIISFIDLTGNTRYGTYRGNYDPNIPSFEFTPKDSSSTETIYLKDVQSFFSPDAN